MEENGLNRDLTCVLFPGIVKNEQKALQCLGGIKELSQIHTTNYKRRLKLSFQPENPSVKPIYSEFKKCSGVLLKVSVKKTKAADGSIKRELLSTVVVGRVTNITCFTSMADFQYLPVEKGEDGKFKCKIDQFIPSFGDMESFNKPATPYIVPKYFSLYDKPFSYMYTGLKAARSVTQVALRSVRSQTVVFDLYGDIPMAPDEEMVKKIREKMEKCPEFRKAGETIEKLFAVRPMWSLNMLLFKTKLRRSTVKPLMPLYAYFFTNQGPWRMLWVRFGYDPRKDPTARFYQTVDFRIRDSLMKNNASLTQQVAPRSRPALKTQHAAPPHDEARVPEAQVALRDGVVPAQRQSNYQICDIDLPEVQALVSPPPAPGILCHETRGWWPVGLADAARKYIAECITRASKNKSQFHKNERESSEEEALSDEEDVAIHSITVPIQFDDYPMDEPSTSNA